MKSCWCQGKGLLCIIINQTPDIKQPLVVNLTSLHGPLCMNRVTRKQVFGVLVVIFCHTCYICTADGICLYTR